MARLGNEHIEWIKLMFDDGRTYSEINQFLLENFRIRVSDDAIRYHCVRKNKPKTVHIDTGITKKLILSDLHIPYEREDIFEIIDRHKDEVDEIIINGDLTDCGEISSYQDLGKYKLTEEMAFTHEFLKLLDNITPNMKKKLILGNHEDRWRRYLSKHTVAFTELHSSNILKEVCNGFSVNDYLTGVETIYRPLPNYTVIDGWWDLVNDTVICHPISFSRVKGKTATMAIDYFIKQGVEFKGIVVAHTHTKSTIPYYDKFAYESGSLCKEMSYSTSGNLGYSPQICGYVLAVFNDGVLNENETKNVFL